MNLRLAHLSDLHLGRGALDAELARARGLIAHALSAGAEHLLLGGDLVDRANLEDLRPLLAYLEAQGRSG